jgi:phospholipid/cholesterol/gamma-HCH transport system substrate-binding protein
MEIRARYVLIGVFLLTMTAAVFGFVYWLENTGGFTERADYKIRFDGPVSGLLSGSAVLFNGIRVGEVTTLGIHADAPREVTANIAIEASTPIREDTVVDIEYQGLTGIAAISLSGGKKDSPLLDTAKGVPVLTARQGSGLTMTQSARTALLKIHGVLDDNSQSFHELISNINEFAGALARNSDKVDGILSGLERMTGGSRGPDTEKVYNLVAATDFKDKATPLQGLVAIPPPTALFNLDTQNILFLPAKDEAPEPPGARWADTLTRLVQAKLSQSFENAGFGGTVGHNDALVGDFQLLIDIRSFQLVKAPEPVAEVEFFTKIANTDGKIAAAKLFKASAPAKSSETTDAVAAFREAFAVTAKELIGWTAASLKPEPESKAEAETAPEVKAESTVAPATQPETPAPANSTIQ